VPEPKPIATIDTSVLVSLQCAGLLAALSVQFDRILVPSKVRSELRDGGERSKAALDALREYSLFENCDDYDPGLVQLLLDTRSAAKKDRDQGEAEAVVQASKRSVNVVLVDDQLGRRWAKNFRIRCHGTIWVCRELRRTGYLNHLRPHYMLLIQGGRRQPLVQMNEFLREFEEAEITLEEYGRLVSDQ
jgi:predicted nucleic acid-binding protein